MHEKRMRSLLVLPLAAAALLATAPGASAFAPSSHVGAPPARAAAADRVLVRPAGVGGGAFGVGAARWPRAPLSTATFVATRGGDRTTRLYMGWGPDPIWSSAVIESNVEACPSGSCVSLTVAVNAETASQFTVPGQYVQVRPSGNDDAQPIFLAIASPPSAASAAADEADAAAGGGGSGTFEFLIKKTDGNDWITAAGPSSSLDVSQVLGNGFPLEENMEGFKYDFPTQNVLLFATGSGIAPIRSAIESGQLGLPSEPGKGGRTARLYYGVRTPRDMPYADKFYEWESRGVEVVPVVSQPESSPAEGGWTGRTGYVQNALEEDGVPIPRNSGALMCGVKGMTDAVRGILEKAGVFEGRVMTNF